jgi:putative phosphoesterase
MLIGVLSDSHGRASITVEAVRLLVDAGAERLLHLGDVGTDEVIEALAGVDARIVLGNCDYPEAPLIRHAERMGVAVDHPIGRFEVDGRTIAFTHGHLADCMQAALADTVDYLLHGHTHVVRDERVGPTRILNPGALFRAARYTVGVLDPTTDQFQVIELPSSRTHS